MFEAVRSGFDGQVAIDDVSFVARPCSMPRLCSFEGGQCGYSSSGNIRWLYRSGATSTITGPLTDHTLETKQGERETLSLYDIHIQVSKQKIRDTES